MALRFLLVAALALVANAFQAPVSVVSRSVQQQQRAQFSVTMMADEVEDKVRTLNRPLAFQTCAPGCTRARARGRCGAPPLRPAAPSNPGRRIGLCPPVNTLLYLRLVLLALTRTRCVSLSLHTGQGHHR